METKIQSMKSILRFYLYSWTDAVNITKLYDISSEKYNDIIQIIQNESLGFGFGSMINVFNYVFHIMFTS